MLSIFARPRPLNRFVLGCHMIVTRSYVRKLEFCNLIGAFTFQYAAILLDQEILRKSPDPFPGGRGLGTRLTHRIVSFPDPAPLRGKEGLGTLVHFLGIFVRFKSCDTCLCACAFQQQARDPRTAHCVVPRGRGLGSRHT